MAEGKRRAQVSVPNLDPSSLNDKDPKILALLPVFTVNGYLFIYLKIILVSFAG